MRDASSGLFDVIINLDYFAVGNLWTSMLHLRF